MAKKREELEKEIKELEEINETDYAEKRAVYSLGFRNLNTLIAFNTYDEITAEVVKTNRGVLSGSLITYVGVSGSGKTTLAAQNLSSMMIPFILKEDERVKVHIIDNESGITRHRFKTLSGFTDNQIRKHVVFEIENSIEYLTELTLKIIKEKKTQKPDRIENFANEKVEVLPPTFIFVDALSEMMPENLSEDEKADNKMMYMTQARLIDQYFKKFKNQFVKYNINMLCIAHMSKRINMDNPMARPSREWKAIPADSKINGGKNFLYNTDIGIIISSIIANSPEAVEKKSASYLKIRNIMEAKLWKSRQGSDNVSFYLCTDSNGFNPLKSFIYECTQLKVIESAGAVKKLKGWDKNFRGSDIVNLITTDEEFRKTLFKAYDDDKAYVFEAGKIGESERKEMRNTLDLMNE